MALTLKEKRHYEVCLERVFTRLAGVGLERLGEEARHRRLVIKIQKTGSGVTLPCEPAFRVLVHFSTRQRLCTSQTYLSRSVGT